MRAKKLRIALDPLPVILPIELRPLEIKAILLGTATQLRRAVDPQPSVCGPSENKWPTERTEPYLDAYCSAERTPENPRRMSQFWCWWTPDNRQGPDWLLCPLGKPGAAFWVKEEFVCDERPGSDNHHVQYRADGEKVYRNWRGASLMVQGESRLEIEVTNVAMQRLHEATAEDATREGLKWASYQAYWEREQGKVASWESNPFCWVVTIKRRKP